MAGRHEFCVRVNFVFMSGRSERVRYCSCHENIKFTSSRHRAIFFLSYKHTDDGVFDDFPKISEDFPKLFRKPDERSRTFSENFGKFTKMSEDCRRLSRKTRKCFDGTLTNLRTF